jgi:hypothetical protein
LAVSGAAASAFGAAWGNSASDNGVRRDMADKGARRDPCRSIAGDEAEAGFSWSPSGHLDRHIV